MRLELHSAVGDITIDLNEPLRGNGRFSIIYKAQLNGSDKEVIVKRLHPRIRTNYAERERFKQEYHPDIHIEGLPKSLDFIAKGDELFLVREYVEGESLAALAESGRFRRMNGQQIRDFFLKLLDRVESLHNAGYVHADLKPSNFLVDGKGQVHLIDLGLSFPLSDPPTRNKQQPLPFSFLYSSPEIMLNYPDLIKESSDVFSLGVILYEFIAGKKPWEDPNPAVLMNLQMVYPLPEHSAISPALLSVLQKATYKHNFKTPPVRLPESEQRNHLQEALTHRYANVDEFRASLLALDPTEVRKRKRFLFF
jgi:serine/threonine protein kinase